MVDGRLRGASGGRGRGDSLELMATGKLAKVGEDGDGGRWGREWPTRALGLSARRGATASSKGKGSRVKAGRRSLVCFFPFLTTKIISFPN
jgi:hypothetical protein